MNDKEIIEKISKIALAVYAQTKDTEGMPCTERAMLRSACVEAAGRVVAQMLPDVGYSRA